ncbi:MAG: 4a-hydroxytetrahydrobiopterin dehydratase [Planctomycetota bacterium]
MPRPIKLTNSVVAKRLKTLSAWTICDNKLHREYQFPDFISAFSWMTAVALVCEKMNHHPNWHHVYNRVEVDLTTHDAGGLTDLDFALAHEMESRFSSYQ